MLVLEYAISGLLFGSTYSLVAIGFTLIFGVLNRFNIAHGATLMVAAFGGATISILFGGKDSYIILIAAFLSATVIGAIVGLIVRQIAFAPLRSGSELSPFVTSAAMALILEELFVNLTQSVSIYSMEVTEFPSPLENLVFFLGEIYIRGAYLVIFLMALIIMSCRPRACVCPAPMKTFKQQSITSFLLDNNYHSRKPVYSTQKISRKSGEHEISALLINSAHGCVNLSSRAGQSQINILRD